MFLTVHQYYKCTPPFLEKQSQIQIISCHLSRITQILQTTMHRIMPSSRTVNKNLPVIHSRNPISQLAVLGCKKYDSITAIASFALNGKATEVFIDTESLYEGYSLINERQLMSFAPDAKILDTETLKPMTISAGGDRCITTAKYVRLDVYIEGTQNDERAIAHMIGEVLVVPDLDHEPVLGVDFLGIHRFSTDYRRKSATIGVCDNITIPLKMVKGDENSASKSTNKRHSHREEKERHKTKSSRYDRYESAEHSFTDCRPQ